MGSIASGADAADISSLSIDPIALIEAITGRKVDRRSMASMSLTDDFEEVPRVGQESSPVTKTPSPDPKPKDVHVGALNPFALVDALLGHHLDRTSSLTTRIISDVLQNDYDELFDMKYNSSLFAGLKLDQKDRVAVPLTEKDIKVLDDSDLVTPNLSRVRQLQDLEEIGFKNPSQARVNTAKYQNGKLHLVLDASSLGKRVTNSNVTMTLKELALPFRSHKEQWTPPNSTWEDAYDVLLETMPRRLITDAVGSQRNGCPYSRESSFDNPVQGSSTNSWLIAAIFSVFWADPSRINRAIRPFRTAEGDKNNKKRTLAIKFHDKGGRNNASTATIEVNYDIPTNNTSMQPVYCHSTDGHGIWPSLYEKAFAKWISSAHSSSSSSQDRPDITQTSNGDPIKAMAQINGKQPEYFFTEKHSADTLVGIVRASSVNLQTVHPMAAWTHATGSVYRGCNLVANHAYSILGWANYGANQYIILRNPFGVTEPAGLTSYPGLIDQVDRNFWPPSCLLDKGGVLALEASAFKEYFACLGLAK